MAMMTAGYDIKREQDGTWTVYDIVSKLPAQIDNKEQVRLSRSEALAIARMLDAAILSWLSGKTH